MRRNEVKKRLWKIKFLSICPREQSENVFLLLLSMLQFDSVECLQQLLAEVPVSRKRRNWSGKASDDKLGVGLAPMIVKTLCSINCEGRKKGAGIKSSLLSLNSI